MGPAMTTGWSSVHVGLPGSGSNFCGKPQMKVPGSGISKLRRTSECHQTLGSTALGISLTRHKHSGRGRGSKSSDDGL